MKKLNSTVCKVLVCAALVAAGGLCLGLPPAFSSQEDITQVRSEALKPHTRPAALSRHDEHNEKAGIDDCATCHHGKDKNGKRDMADMTAGTDCVECHAVSPAKGQTSLRRAFHLQCMGCHQERKQGPLYCTGCHTNG